VHDAPRVRRGQRVGDLCRVRDRHGDRQAARRRVDDGAEVRAVEQLHHQEHRLAGRVPVRVDVEHHGDARMLQRRGGLRLPAEPGHRLLVGGQIGGKDLEGDRPPQPQVGGAPDLAHAAPPDRLFQPVAVADDHAGFQ
jgi:hypothetical protein